MDCPRPQRSSRSMGCAPMALPARRSGRRRLCAGARGADSLSRQSPAHRDAVIDGRRKREAEGRQVRVLAVRRLARRRTEAHPPRRTLPRLSSGPPCLPAVPAPCDEGSGRMPPRSCRPGDRQDERELLHVLPAGSRRLARRCRCGQRPCAGRPRRAVRPCTGAECIRGGEIDKIGCRRTPRSRCPVRNRA